MELITSWQRKARQEGRLEGRQEGRLATIKRQLTVQTGKLSVTSEKQLERLGEAELKTLTESLLDFASELDLERWLAAHRH
jgi:predicted transposase YdaD